LGRRRAACPSGVHPSERLTSEAEWLAARPEQRFLRFGVGPGDPPRLSVGWMRYFAFRAAVHDPRFAAYLERITQLELGSVSSFSAHAMGPGDLLAPHNDVNPTRKLAFIFYFTRDWRPAHGGALIVTGHDGSAVRIVPDFNTLVLFEVTGHKEHRVQPIADEAGAKRRLSVSGWFDHPPSLDRR
jgi:Rps23 Pro-64 3,4-dihydroxylase Tpa1-like proline 4-hydroxylase